EEEHPAVRPGGRAGPWDAGTAADDGRGGGRVVRVLERRAAQQAAAGVEGAGDGGDGGHLERVAVVEVRPETGEPGGQHGLAGTGRNAYAFATQVPMQF